MEVTHYNTGKKENVSDLSHPMQLAGTASYDILMNSAYRYKMQYVPSWWLDRLSYIATPKYEIDSSMPDSPLQIRKDIHEGNIYSKREREAPNNLQKHTVLAAKAQSDYVRMIVDIAYMPKARLDEVRSCEGLTTHGLLQYMYKRN